MKIFAIANNHRAGTMDADKPILFTKADSALLKGGRPFFLPDELGRVEYAVSLVVRLCRLGKSIPERFAHRYYDAVTCGVDFTAVDLLAQCRQQGWPWELAKGFDGAAAIGDWMLLSDLSAGNTIETHVDVNGQTQQRLQTDDLMFSIDATVAYISRFFTIRTGDLLFVGMPPQSNPISVNDHIDGYLNGRKVMGFNVK